MKERKILFIGMLAIFAIVIAGSASAFDLNFFGNDSSPEEVTIEGLNFTIPDGYKEVKNGTLENEKVSMGSVTYVMNAKSYMNSDGDDFAILIADYGDYNVTDDVLKQIAPTEKTVNGHKGYVKTDDNYTIFVYEEEGDLVTISASDENIFDQIVV